MDDDKGCLYKNTIPYRVQTSTLWKMLEGVTIMHLSIFLPQLLRQDSPHKQRIDEFRSFSLEVGEF